MKWFVLTNTTLSYYNKLSDMKHNKEPRRTIPLTDVAHAKPASIDVSGVAHSFVRVHLDCSGSARENFPMLKCETVGLIGWVSALRLHAQHF